MILADYTAFPNNAIAVLRNELSKVDVEVPVYTRPIRVGDPIQAFAVVPANWSPDENSWEVGGLYNTGAPTIGEYLIAVQCFNQDMDEERGLATASAMSQLARNAISRSMDIRVALSLLKHVNDQGVVIERFHRAYVRGQRFLTNEVDGSFLHLSSLEVMIETEIVQ